MGYGKIFWIDERPIRKTLQENFKHLIEGASSCKSSNPATDFGTATDRKELFAKIGNCIIQLTKREGSEKFSLPFNGQANVFNYAATLHSTSETLLMWTGNKLRRLGVDFFANQSFKTIVNLEKETDYNCIAFALDHHIRNSIINKTSKWDNIAATKGEYSIYWLYEDYSQRHNTKNDSVVGEQFLNLMLTNWSSSKSILNHGNAINKVCFLLEPQFAFFIWTQNCLRILADIDTEKVLDYLKKDSE
ncbi:MAG: hypothetical protein RBR32_09605 [Bacteroidales bacterium]|nr:hypothetical protein [Bacteroidales bacterium]